MKKLISLILAVCLIAAIIVPTYAEERGEPIIRMWSAVEATINEIRDNATGDNGDTSWPHWVWRLELPCQGEKEVWIGFKCIAGQESGGTLEAMIRDGNGCTYLYQYQNAWETSYLFWCDDPTLPDEYVRVVAEKPTRGTTDYGYVSGKLDTKAFAVRNKAWTVDGTNVGDDQIEAVRDTITEELCWAIDAWQWAVEEAGYKIWNLGWYCLSGTSGRLCRYHAWGDQVIIKAPTATSWGYAEETCSRCHFTRFVALPPVPFEDVPETAWYAEAVDWAVEQGITNGTSETTFSPNAKCTRAQIVTFLWAEAGRPESDAATPFTDVPPNAWYAEAVSWAYANGITTGTGRASFNPKKECTRAEIVTMLWRANGSPESSVQTRFADVDGSEWYADAVRWAAANGITAGKRDNSFAAFDTCTRAEAVTFLWRADSGEE